MSKSPQKVLLRVLPFLLIAAIVLALIFYPKNEKTETALVAVRVWNIDTFEGGKGSRTAFLKRAASSVEKKKEGVYYLVTSYTAEGAEAAYLSGEAPDLISFGVGFSVFAGMSLPIPYECGAGELDGKTLAVAWCRGCYYLFSQSGPIGAEGTVLSDGGSNLVQVAAKCSGIEGKAEEPIAAYTDFLAGKFRYLLGTQRDVCRFAARGAQVEMKELHAYNDLYQYISVLSLEKRDACLALIDELLSPAAQASLSDIGMLPIEGDPSENKLRVFTDANALAELRRLTDAGDEKNLDNFLKTVLINTEKCGRMIGA